MITGFNPSVSNNKNQKTNFKALPIDKITKNDAEADMFTSAALRKGLYNNEFIVKTEENVKDLLAAIEKAKKEKKFGVVSFLEELRDEIWKVKQ